MSGQSCVFIVGKPVDDPSDVAMSLHDSVTKNLVQGKNRSGRTNFGDQKWSGRTENDAKICPVNPKLVRARRLVLFYVKMDYSSEEGDAKNGSLVEETYEYLVRNVYPVSRDNRFINEIMVMNR